MKKHISYPKIGQFRQVVRSIQLHSTYIGKDEDENPIYDSTIKKPILTFKGTVKLHGTNASICFNPKDGLWIQSRKNIITFENDNAGFAAFVEKNKVNWTGYFEKVYLDYKLTNETLVLYGEWAGKGIQKGVGISEINKSFFLFGLKISTENEESNYWKKYKKPVILGVYDINDFKTYEIEIDFNDPRLIQNKLIEITEKVEKECPVAKTLRISGVGEGVVWSCGYENNRYSFKVKGEKHSISKVKKLANVNVEKLESINKFIEYTVTENRVIQGIKEVFGDEVPDRRGTGDFLRWIANDIVSEEKDTILENNLEWKEIQGKLSNVARNMFFTKIDIV